MTMYEELVKALRTCSERDSCFWLGDTCPYMGNRLCDDKAGKAADAIEELQKQLDNSEIDNIKLKEAFAKYRGENRWIPVTERLPEEYKYVLCKTDYGMEVGYHRNEWGQDEWTTGKFASGSFDVTHWMPLPEPPKDGEE